jgi:cytochrome c553
MSEHFGFAAAARDAMTRGDLPAVRESLLQLADYPYTESVPGAWLPRVRALQDDARATAQATTLESVAAGVSVVARACGDCHHATGGALAASVVAREQAQRPDTLPERMFRHRRAAEQMWLGLIAPSRAAWNDGATSLANASFEVEVHGRPPARFAEGLESVRALGKRSLFAETREDQARAYAALLSACANCHREPIDDLQ